MTTVRFVLGSLSLLSGAFWLVVNLAYSDPQNVVVGAVLAAGGLLVLFWDRLRLPARLVVPAAVTGGLAGTSAGLATGEVVLGGEFGWFEYRGWPFAWLERGGLADSPSEAQRVAEASGWSAEPFRLVTDLVFHSYTMLVLIVGLIFLVRALRGRFAPKVMDEPGY